MKKIDYKKKYNELKLEFEYQAKNLCKLTEENAYLQEKLSNRKCVSNDTNYEIIRRLDIIGDLLGDFLKENELKESREKLEKAQKEVEMLTFDCNARVLTYSNKYEDRLKWECTCEK